MNNWKKVGVYLLTGIFLSITVIGFSACTKQETSVESQNTENVALTEGIEMRPSMAPAKMTVNGTELEPALYDFWYYNNYDEYIYEIPQNDQGEPDMTALSGRTETETWQDTLHSLTMDLIQQGVVLNTKASENNIKLDEAGIAEVDAFFHSVSEQATQIGVSDDLILQSIYGKHATVEVMQVIVENYFIASKEAESIMNSFEYSDSEIKTYFDANQDMFGAWEIPIVRHILFSAEDGVSEEEDTNAKKAADETLAKIDAGEDMETLGNTLQSEEKAMESAEYEVWMGQMVPEFEEWCYDETRKEGDTGIVKTTYGYHVMKLIGFSNQAESVRYAMQDEAYMEFIEKEGELPKYKIEIS